MARRAAEANLMLDELDLGFDDDGRERGRHRHRRAAARGGRGAARPPRRRGRTFLALLLSLVLLGGLGAGGWYGYEKVRDFFTAPDYSSAGTGEVRVQVRNGQTAADIAETLYAAGVVKSPNAFVSVARGDSRSTAIQPGTYRLRQQMRAADALELLLDKANKVISKVTVREGLSFQATYNLLADSTGIPLAQFEAAGKDPIALGVPDFWFNRTDGKQSITSVEGFLYPATYEFDPGATAEQILRKMISQFLKTAESIALVRTAEAKSITPFEALVTASLVQAEAGVKGDMPKVARVVYNRLAHKPDPMMLEFDSTANYWRDLHGQERKHNLSDAELTDPNNPYRTYGVLGLPPGPIGNPGQEALAAAINPTPNEKWLYFVLIDKAGNSAFADDLKQHERNFQIAKQNGVF